MLNQKATMDAEFVVRKAGKTKEEVKKDLMTAIEKNRSDTGFLTPLDSDIKTYDFDKEDGSIDVWLRIDYENKNTVFEPGSPADPFGDPCDMDPAYIKGLETEEEISKKTMNFLKKVCESAEYELLPEVDVSAYDIQNEQDLFDELEKEMRYEKEYQDELAWEESMGK